MLVALVFLIACIAFNRWYKATHPKPTTVYRQVWVWQCQRCGTRLTDPFCPCDDLPDDMIPRDDFELWEAGL